MGGRSGLTGPRARGRGATESPPAPYRVPTSRRGSVTQRRRWSRHEIALIGLFVVSLPLITPYIRGDGVKYYAWLRSAVIDADLHFLNEYRHGDPIFKDYYLTPDGSLEPQFWTRTDHVENQAGTGEALLWLPFFLIGHGVVLIGQALGAAWQADGYALPYVWFTSFGTALYVLAGLLLSFRLARRIADPGPAMLATLAVWGATSLPVYQYFLPIKGVAMTVLPATVVLWLWLRPSWRLGRWLFLGLLSAFLVSIHPVAVAWTMLPLVSLLGLDTGTAAQRLRATAAFLAGAVIGALPQLLGKAIVYGNPLETGYPEEVLRLLDPDFACVLVGSCRGFLAWTPITGLALAGLGLLVRVDRRTAIGLWAVFLSMLYLIAIKVTVDISSFGNRFSVIFTPGLILGAAVLAHAVWKRWRILAVGLVAIAVMWNGLLAFQWAWGMLPKRGDIDWSQVARAQFTTAPPELRRAVVLFFTDRGELVRIMQRRDLERLRDQEGIQ